MNKSENLKKIVNIIYYVDTDKTKTIKMSYLSFLSICILSLCILIWTVGSFFYIGKTSYDIKVQNQKLLEAKATIFEYQSKYDNIFEHTYTNNSTHDLANNSETSKNKEHGSILTPSKKEEPSSGKSLAAKPLSEDSPLQIQHAGTFKQDKSITSLIDLKNDSDTKINGRIWGVAYYKNKADSSISEVFYPESMKSLTTTTKHENVDVPLHSITFNIRYYKQQKIVFNRPNKEGSFTKFDIYVTDGNKIYKKVYTVDESILKYKEALKTKIRLNKNNYKHNYKHNSIHTPTTL